MYVRCGRQWYKLDGQCRVTFVEKDWTNLQRIVWTEAMEGQGDIYIVLENMCRKGGEGVISAVKVKSAR